MNRRTLYPLLAILIVITIYSYDLYLEKASINKVIEVGKQEKKETNLFFLPTSTTGQIVHHEGYSLSYHESYEQAEWVAYELKKAHLSNTNFNRPYFEIDPAVKTNAAHWKNYKKSGYTRGHLCPAADRRFSKAAHDETFLTSNISPQLYEFNSGIWNRLEQKVRFWAEKNDGVFVVTGGVLNGSLKTIGEEKVGVPKQFYKIILDYNQGVPKMIAFLMDHENSRAPLYEFVTSTDAIEALTGIDFFPQLEDTTEKILEGSSDYKNWSF